MLLSNIKDFFYEKLCFICRQKCQHFLCLNCENISKNINACKVCAASLTNNKCECCLNNDFKFQSTYALYTNDLYFKIIIYAIKNGHISLLKYLSLHLAQNFQESLFINNLPKPDLLLPIPLNNKKLIQRGYNQSLVITKILSKYLNIPYNINILLKNKHNLQTQHFLNKLQRQQNINNIFTYQNLNSLKNLHVAIVDDVFTTGATVNEIAINLQKYCSSISNVVIARTKYIPLDNQNIS